MIASMPAHQAASPVHKEPQGHPDETPTAIVPGQLSFGPQQGVLSEAELPPQQLALLPDPPPWEQDPGPPPLGRAGFKQGRMAKKHSRMGTSPGQVALF